MGRPHPFTYSPEPFSSLINCSSRSTSPTLLLDLDGVSVIRVERLGDGTRRVHLATADASARACPVCGVFAARVKGAATTRPRDLLYGERRLEFVWHKRRWRCREVFRDLNLSWPVVMDAFRITTATVIEAPLPEVSVLGIDESRRGRTRWEQDPGTGKWQLTRDRWHTGCVDALGIGGLLGQVEGRAVTDVLAWLSSTPLAWRNTIRHVAIDMSATYRAAIRTGLPDAIVVVDHFPAVQLANTMLSLVRRRTTAELRGRRGRAADPERREGRTHPADGVDRQGEPAHRPCPGPHRRQVGHARWKFLTWCADPDIPEVRTLAATVDRWWARGRHVPRHRSQQRQERGHQPRDLARRPQRVRVPQR
ncbi:transposase [Streptomyces sp. NPDC021622]|uniref:transposase n=1 Tax=Streptomyces sp. NPDC021622 TaxID=3155013 RepID=UPI0033DE9300